MLSCKEICYVLKLTIPYLLVIIRTFIINIKILPAVILSLSFIETVEAVRVCVLITIRNREKLITGVYYVVVGFFNSNNSIMISIKIVGMVIFIWNIQFKSHTLRSIQNP